METRYMTYKNEEGQKERFYPITHKDAIVGLDSAGIGSNNDLVDTELSEIIIGEEPDMDVVVQNTIIELENTISNTISELENTISNSDINLQTQINELNNSGFVIAGDTVQVNVDLSTQGIHYVDLAQEIPSIFNGKTIIGYSFITSTYRYTALGIGSRSRVDYYVVPT